MCSHVILSSYVKFYFTYRGVICKFLKYSYSYLSELGVIHTVQIKRSFQIQYLN